MKILITYLDDLLRKRKYIFFLLILFVNNKSTSQQILSDFEFININNNFPKRGITGITNDEQGFVWISTLGAGVYKYDGVQYLPFRYNFQDSTSVNSDVVHEVFRDSKNQLWIGNDGGLNLYNRSLSNFSTISFEEKGNLADEQIIILSVIEDLDGRILAGSNYNGLFLVDLKTKIAKEIPYNGKHLEQAPLHILDFAISSSGTIYVATNLGLKQIDPQSNILKDALIYTNKETTTIDFPLQCLLIDKLNNLWIGSQADGVFKSSCLNANEVSLKYLDQFEVTQRRVMSMDESKSGHIYCGTENDGLLMLNQKGEILKKVYSDQNSDYGLKSNSIWNIYFDKQERLWLGYYDKGIDVSDPNYRKFDKLDNLLKEKDFFRHKSITGLVKDPNGNIWLATDGNGVYRVDTLTKNITAFLNDINPNNMGAAIHTLLIDTRGNLWAGSWDEGIFLLKKDQNAFINFTNENTNGDLQSNRIMSFAEDSNGVIWFGTWGKGIHSYDYNKNKFVHHDSHELQEYGLDYQDVRKLIVDKEDCIWAGTTKGLFKIKFDENLKVKQLLSLGEEWKKKSEKHSGFNNILSLYLDTQGSIWIGTDGAGLLKYETETKQLTKFDSRNGLKQLTVSSIIESQPGHIWISGRSGISSLDVNTGIIRNYSKEDGLISNDFNINAVLKDKEGLLYYGNIMGGVNFFSPDSIPKNQSSIKVYLTNLRLFNKNVTPGDETGILSKTLELTDQITLDYGQSVFTIDYTGINFTRSERNQFAYYLEGLEDEWNYVGKQRSATYTSLKEGNYTFKVKAANNDGLWNEEAVTLDIKVLPPWWRSSIGYFIYFILALSALYVFYRMMRMRVLSKEEVEYERQRREQEQELNKKKLQFFTNISHEFRTPLTLIINPLEDMLNDDTHDFNDEIQSKHITIHKNAKRLQRLINELMDFRKLSFNKLKVRPRKTEIIRFVTAVAEYFNSEAIDKNINFKVESKLDQQYTWIDSGLIEKVLFNLLSNAFKVTPLNGEILINIDTSQEVLPLIDNSNEVNALSIAISDTGPGLSKDHIKHVFERFYQVDNLNKTYYGGTGIGLELVNSLVKLHEGKIEVESKLNVGTTFIIYLPINQNQFSNPQKTNQPLTKQDEKTTNILNGNDKKSNSKESKRITLLIIEDNIELQNYLKTELQKLYNVKTSNNGKEGLDLALDTQPDIILTDIMMPKMNGFEVCEKIRSDVRTSHIPLIMLTAKTNIEEKVQANEIGVDAFISKPFDMILLKSRIKQLLKGRQILFNKYLNGKINVDLNENTNTIDKTFIHQLVDLIHKRIGDTSLNVEALASEVFLSRSQLYRKIKALTGLSVNEFIRKIRIEEAKKILEKGNHNVSEVCYAVGFSSPSYFSKCFKEQFGILPTDLIR